MKDPVHYCQLYKAKGCSHVDGYLCNYDTCEERIAFRPKTIAFDFDNVIHKYRKGWQGGKIYDELDRGMLNLIKELLDEGNKVFILSTRSRKQIKKHFDSFKVKHDGQTWVGNQEGMDLSWTDNPKIPFEYKTFSIFRKFWNEYNVCGICNHKAVFDVLIDDRAINFNPTTPVTKNQILSFKPIIYKK